MTPFLIWKQCVVNLVLFDPVWCVSVLCSVLVSWALQPRPPRPQAPAASNNRHHKHQQPATTGPITQESQGGNREAIHVISPLCRLKTLIWKLCVLNLVLFDPVWCVLVLCSVLVGWALQPRPPRPQAPAASNNRPYYTGKPGRQARSNPCDISSLSP